MSVDLYSKAAKSARGRIDLCDPETFNKRVVAGLMRLDVYG